MNVVASPGASVPSGAEIPTWDFRRSAPWHAVSAARLKGRGARTIPSSTISPSFALKVFPGHGDTVWWWIPQCSAALFSQLFLPATSLFASELMPGISSVNRQRGLWLHYFCWHLFLPSPHASYLSVSCHKFGWSKGRDAVTSSRQGYCPVLALKCHAHLCYRRNNK